MQLTVHWSGADPDSRVVIPGASFLSNANISVQFACTTPGGAGGFTVPPFILETPPTGATGAQGFLAVQVYDSTRFSASGLDAGSLACTTGPAKVVEWQNPVTPPPKR